MKLKAYIWINRLLSLLSIIALVIIITYVDPEKTGWPGKSAFYICLFFFLSGFFGLLLAFARRKTFGADSGGMNARLNMRQGMLLALLAVILLIIQSFRMLVWWDGMLAVAGIFLVELYFLSKN